MARYLVVHRPANLAVFLSETPNILLPWY